MPLIDCPECGRRVSDRARACPDCGGPVRPPGLAPETWRTIRANGAVLGLIGLLGMGWEQKADRLWSVAFDLALGLAVLGLLVYLAAEGRLRPRG